MACRPEVEKKYRLRDGSRGTEYEALSEVLKTLKTRQQELEDQIEAIVRRLQVAEGAPNV